MILEYDISTLSDFLAQAPKYWLLPMLLLVLIVAAFGFLIVLLRRGFNGSGKSFSEGLGRSFFDIAAFSPSRLWAITRLTIKESIRRRVVVIGVVFLLVLLFAGWFLDPNSENPAKLFHSFVLTMSTYLIMLLALFLSSFSLPTDFKMKTIYTVVTKPVRSSEMVLGRILGVALITSVILLFMGLVSYAFVGMKLNHTHLLSEQEDLTRLESGPVLWKGETQLANGHKHEVSVLDDGTVEVSEVNGHKHDVSFEEIDGKRRYIVQNQHGTIQARTPIYGKLGFRNQQMLDTDEGINVGNEWMYRSYIGGGSKGAANEEAAIFTFSDITPERFHYEDAGGDSEGLVLEMTLGVFRTHMADIEKTVMGAISIRNPHTGLRVEALTFSTEEFIIKAVQVPWKIQGTPQITQRRARNATDGSMIVTPSDADMVRFRNDPQLMHKGTFDFFEDFVHDGKVEIWLQCIESGQYIGVSQGDMYIRGPDGLVLVNFAKGFFGIWMQMLIVIAFGVLFSTFLSGPVALLSTVGIMIAGYWKTFMLEIAENTKLGGGPFESLYRLVTGENMMTDLPPGFTTSFIKASDEVYSYFMTLASQIVPPLSDFQIYHEALVNGFNISWQWMAVHGLQTAAYVLPLFLVAYVILNAREVAK